MKFPLLRIRPFDSDFFQAVPVISIKTTEEDFRKWNLDINWPIGSVWTSRNATDPGKIVGGEWKPLTGMILAADDKHHVGEKGGAEEIRLTEPQLPPHSHSIYFQWPGGTPSPVANRISSSSYVFEGNSEPALELKSTSAGQGQAVNIMNPYDTFYRWERVR